MLDICLGAPTSPQGIINTEQLAKIAAEAAQHSEQGYKSSIYIAYEANDETVS